MKTEKKKCPKCNNIRLCNIIKGYFLDDCLAFTHPEYKICPKCHPKKPLKTTRHQIIKKALKASYDLQNAKNLDEAALYFVYYLANHNLKLEFIKN